MCVRARLPRKNPLRNGVTMARSSRLVLWLCASASLPLLGGAAGTARALCFPWKCCDAAGYDMDGLYTSKDRCEDDGGVVECGTLVCSGDNIGPFKCCQSDGDPFPGVYLSRHACTDAGGTVFEDEAFCPGFAFDPFRCCDPDGGDAPGVFTYRYQCEDAGYDVREQTFCPHGWGDAWRCCDPDGRDAPLHFTRHGCEADGYEVLEEGHCPGPKRRGQLGCLTSNRDHYLPILQARAKAYNATHTDRWSDKDSHCAMSCFLQLSCGKLASILAGVGKEVLDLVDGVKGNSFGSGDICADRRGNRVADRIEDEGLDELQCLTLCEALPLESECARSSTGGR